MQKSQHLANYQELSNIHHSLSNGVTVDQNRLMKALLGSMMDLMSWSGQVSELKEEIKILSNSVSEVENELSDTKHKLFKLEYDVKEMEEKEGFQTKDSIVIRNVAVPSDGDEHRIVKEALKHLNIEDFVPEEDVIKVERKGQRDGKLGSVFAKLHNEEFKVKVKT